MDLYNFINDPNSRLMETDFSERDLNFKMHQNGLLIDYDLKKYINLKLKTNYMIDKNQTFVL